MKVRSGDLCKSLQLPARLARQVVTVGAGAADFARASRPLVFQSR